MKLDDWFIQDAIRSGDLLTAVNAVCTRFGLPHYSENSPEMISLVVTGKFYPNVPEQMRIVSGDRAYTWVAGEGARFAGQWNGAGVNSIRIWTDHY